MGKTRSVFAWCLASVVMLPVALAESTPQIRWVEQFGTISTFALDDVRAVDSDGNVYLAGSTTGSMRGDNADASPVHEYDAYLRKYDAQGTEIWTRQIGTAPGDQALGIAVTAAGVYVVGWTSGALPGQTNEGGFSDAFIRMYDLNGNEHWTRQFGSSSVDRAQAVAADATGAYVAGFVEGPLPGQTHAGRSDAFLRKYDTNGNEVWTRQFGSAAFYSDSAHAVALDGTSVYVAGATGETLPGESVFGGHDAFVRKYDTNGTPIWFRNFGTIRSDVAFGVSADASGVYVTGNTEGAFPGFPFPGIRRWTAFLRKYSSDEGIAVWTQQIHASGTSTEAFAVSVADSGVYVAGRTEGAFPGETSAGQVDAYLGKFTHDGTILWTRQLGAQFNDDAFGVIADSSGAYVVGAVSGPLPGQSITDSATDGYVRRYDTSGSEVWTRQFGGSGPGTDGMTGIAMHATGVYTIGYSPYFVRKYDRDGGEVWSRKLGAAESLYDIETDETGVYVVGSTPNALAGETQAGLVDAFIRKYDFDGNTLWTDQFGIAPTAEFFETVAVATGVVASGGNVFVFGSADAPFSGEASAGIFVRKYDSSGGVLWTRQSGTAPGEYVRAAAGGGNAMYLLGGGAEPFVRRYDSEGTPVWTQPLESTVLPTAISATASSVYVAGSAGDSQDDAFVRSYSSTGSEVWTRQFGTASWDTANSVFADSAGVLVAGSFDEGTDAYVRRYDDAGSEVWTLRFGTSSYDEALAVAGDFTGTYVGGVTRGAFPGHESDPVTTDGFIARISTSITIGDVISAVDAAVANGDLGGDGPGNSGPGRLGAWLKMLDGVQEDLEAGNLKRGCDQLQQVYLRIDGTSPPPDFVAGAVAPVIAEMVRQLRADLGCSW